RCKAEENEISAKSPSCKILANGKTRFYRPHLGNNHSASVPSLRPRPHPARHYTGRPRPKSTRGPKGQRAKGSDGQGPEVPDGQMARWPDGQRARWPDGQTARRPDGQTARRPDGQRARGPTDVGNLALSEGPMFRPQSRAQPSPESSKLARWHTDPTTWLCD